MRSVTNVFLTIALVGSQGCLEGLHAAGVVDASNRDRPSVAGPFGSRTVNPRLASTGRAMPGQGGNIPLPETATPYHALSVPTLSERKRQRVYAVLDSFMYYTCEFAPTFADTSDRDCTLKLDHSIVSLILKVPASY